MKYIGLVLLILFSGCSTTHPPVVTYKIDPQIKTNNKTTLKYPTSTLKVSETFVDHSLRGIKIKYIDANQREYSYNNSRYAQELNLAITNSIIKTIKDAKIFKNVVSYRSKAKAQLYLEVNLYEFMQYFSKDEKKSYVKVDIDLDLIDNKTLKIIKSKRFKKQKDTNSADAHGGIEALNETLAEIEKEIIIWLGNDDK